MDDLQSSSQWSSGDSRRSYDNKAFVMDKELPIHMYDLGEIPGQSNSPPVVVIEMPQTQNEDNNEKDYSLLSLFPVLRRGLFKVKRRSGIKSEDWPRIEKLFLVSLLAAGYLTYFIAVLVIYTTLQDTDYWCDGDGLLIILTSLTAIGLAYFQIIKPYFGKVLNKTVIEPLAKKMDSAFSNPWVSIATVLVAFGALLAFIIYDSWEELRRLQSLIGLAVLIIFGFLFSAAPVKIRWRHVIWGIALQFIMGLIILKWSVGQAIFDCLAGKVTTFLKFTDAGSSFVFGLLVTDYGIFAFTVLSVTLFFSFCVQILFYFGAMQLIVIKLGWLLQVTIGTTACESVNSAANIFLGQSEAPLIIKPYLGKMTKSEIHAVMTGGFATIAGSVLAAYISFGVDAASLLSASVMSAPAALAFSKLFYPEVEQSKTTTKDIKIDQGDEANWLHAAMVGVTNAIPIVANIAANLICFYAFISFCSYVLNWFCMLAGADDGVCNIENIFGWIFMPLAWVLGVDWDECHKVGELIGLKTVLNEFVAYEALARMLEAGELSDFLCV